MNRNRCPLLRTALSLAAAVFLTLAARAQPAATDAEFFEKRVRPLLADNCYSCHGAASIPVRGGLRLDVRAGLLKGGAHGSLFAAGQPDKSLLMRAVRYTDPGLRMPPKGRLANEQIAVLKDWILQGANVPAAVSAAPLPGGIDLKLRARHWAWQPVKRPPIPSVRNKAWVHNPIDAFVLARLEAKRISPARSADKRTLLRRVTFDLTGLPPTAEDIHAFLADNSPNAYAKVVDRLLASPHYGERWARHWLDLVRYAETDGHEWDIEKTGAWQYRDYVIRALNSDVPYNQFVLEHIAGDLLARPRLNPTEKYNESVLGTGFYFLGSAKHSPVDLKDDEAERIDNQIDVLGKAFLGMGIGCARCHDHKFDAISTRDYYALYGFLKGTRLQEAPVGRPMPLKLRSDLENVESGMQQTLDRSAANALKRSIDPGAPGWEARVSGSKDDLCAVLYPLAILAGRPELQVPAAFSRAREEVLRRLRARADQEGQQDHGVHWLTDGPLKWQGWSRTGDAFPPDPAVSLTAHVTAGATTTLAGVFEPGVFDSGLLADRLMGTLRSPTFTIDKPTIVAHLAGRNGRVRLIIQGYQRLRDPIYGRLAFDVDNSAEMKWYDLDVREWIGHEAYIEFVDSGPGFIAIDKVGLTDSGPPVEAPNPLVVKMLQDPAINSAETLIERYRAVFEETAAMARSGHMDAEAASRWSLLRWAALAMPQSESETHRLAELESRRTQLDADIVEPTPALAATDGPGETERVHIRGNYRTTGPEAPRRFLEVCDPGRPVTTMESSGRLELAERMLAPTDPLPARVIVNRLWLHHFGEGIVRTPDDFGVMGERPTHPELLDWLASEFMANTANVRDSSAARAGQKSDTARSMAGVNDRFACGWSLKKLHRLMVLSSVYQMDSVSASYLEASDPQNRLLHRMPVRRLEAECVRDTVLAVSGRLDPTLCGPPIMPFLNAFTPGRGAAPSGPLDGAGRRSIYLSVRRNFLIPMFLAFDYPNPITTIGRRTVSNVPAQALTLLNNPFVAEQAQVWAKHVLSQPGSTDDHITAFYEAGFGRLPRPEELAATRAFVEAQSRAYGDINDPRGWSDLCHVLFNVKEFIYIR